jgi:hypothetical protein
MVRMREMMRSEFYQSLFLKRQKEMDDYSCDEKKGEGDKWTIKGIWRRLVGRTGDRQVKRENKIVLGGGRIKTSRIQGLVF